MNKNRLANAGYLDARKHFAQLKAARGYFPVVALADSGLSMAATMQRRHNLQNHPRAEEKDVGK